MLRTGATWLLLAVLAAAGPAAAQFRAPDEVVRPVEVHAKAITVFDPAHPVQRRFGALEFLGGLELTSPDKAFGGFSSLHVAADGRHFVAVSDKGNWLRGEIAYEGERPAAIHNAEMAPMLAADGRPLARRGWYDTESLAAEGGTFYVGIERVNRVVRFDYGRHRLQARAAVVPVPLGVRKLPNNKGLEGMVFVPHGRLAGTLIAFAERRLDAAGNNTAFLIGGPAPGTFHLRRHDDFDISDATLSPDGDVLVLERRFSWLQGLAARIRRIPLNEIKPGALVDGPELFAGDLSQQIDNMEGISAFRRGDTVVLTLISDDNFLPLERTLLLQFALRTD